MRLRTCLSTLALCAGLIAWTSVAAAGEAEVLSRTDLQRSRPSRSGVVLPGLRRPDVGARTDGSASTARGDCPAPGHRQTEGSTNVGWFNRRAIGPG